MKNGTFAEMPADEPVKTERKAEEPKFPVSRLREDCRALFGVPTHLFDGAFYGKEDRLYTISQAKEIINTWKAKEVG